MSAIDEPEVLPRLVATCRGWTVLVAAALTGATTACAGSMRPDLAPGDVRHLSFSGLSPRTLRLKVTDRRAVVEEDAVETERRVLGVVREALQEAHVAVDDHAPHRLEVVFINPEQGIEGYGREHCVQAQGSMYVNGKGFVESKAVGCFEWRHLIGISLGGDSTRAFKTAINMMFEDMDRRLPTITGRPDGGQQGPAVADVRVQSRPL